MNSGMPTIHFPCCNIIHSASFIFVSIVNAMLVQPQEPVDYLSDMRYL